MSESHARYRVGVDIGGTFTDVALAGSGENFTSKVLTTPRAPEEGVLEGLAQALGNAGIDPGDVEVVIHGTTLATNAIIERKGAKTALVVTEGFRDSVEMAYENRFEQYDIHVQKPAPLVPRYLRVPVRERVDAAGKVLLRPDSASIDAIIERLAREGVESIAIGFVHGYANPAHEELVAERLREAFPDVWLTLSSDVCAEIREYERLSTACANAYVQPLMARYLQNLGRRMEEAGLRAPLLMMTLGRRAHHRRDRDPASHPAGRVGAGGRRDPREPARGGEGARPGALLRHGRHHRQDLPHRRRPAPVLAHLRGGPCLPLHQGQWAAAAHSGHRDGGDRGGRRLHRAARSFGPHCGRPGERGGGAGAGLLRKWR